MSGPVPNNQHTHIPIEEGANEIELRLRSLDVDGRAVLTQDGKPLLSLQFMLGGLDEDDYWIEMPIERSTDSSQSESVHHAVDTTIELSGAIVRLPDLSVVEHGKDPPSTDVDPTAEYTLPLLCPMVQLPSAAYRDRIVGCSTTAAIAGTMAVGDFYGMSGIGLRSDNRDVVRIASGQGRDVTLMVLDGAYREGLLAATLVGEFVAEELRRGECPHTALSQASCYLETWIRANRPELLPTVARGLNGRRDVDYQMATCVVLAEVKDGNARFSHVGDCRGYLLRRNEEGHFAPVVVTEDHTGVKREMDERNCSRMEVSAQVRNEVERMVLARLPDCGRTQHDVVESGGSIPLQSGDIILLHSDGAHALEIGSILAIIRAGDTVHAMGRALQNVLEAQVRTLRDEGGPCDNYSVCLFEYKG